MPETQSGNPAMGGMQRGNMGPGMGMGLSPMGPGGGPSGPMQGMTPNGPLGPNPQVSDAQLAQQQSEIFVFSTQLANDAAEAVHSGQYKNLLSFHMDQPATKKFLQVLVTKSLASQSLQSGFHSARLMKTYFHSATCLESYSTMQQSNSTMLTRISFHNVC